MRLRRGRNRSAPSDLRCDAALGVGPARKLLATTEMKVYDIAEKCGFYDQSHFIRTFKGLRRQTPAQYRRAHFSA